MKTTPEQRAQWRKLFDRLGNRDKLCNLTYEAVDDLLGDLEAAERELKGCSTAAASYSEAVALGEPFGDAMKAVLICRQSLDAAIARYTEAERVLAEQRERAEVLEEAVRMFCRSQQVVDAQLAEARARIASRKEIADGL